MKTKQFTFENSPIRLAPMQQTLQLFQWYPYLQKQINLYLPFPEHTCFVVNLSPQKLCQLRGFSHINSAGHWLLATDDKPLAQHTIRVVKKQKWSKNSHPLQLFELRYKWKD